MSRGFVSGAFRDCDFCSRPANNVAMTVAQAQAQAQAQDQDQDQDLKSVFKDIGNNNIHITIDNENIAVLVLVALGVLTGGIAAPELRTYIEKILAKSSS